MTSQIRVSGGTQKPDLVSWLSPKKGLIDLSSGSAAPTAELI